MFDPYLTDLVQRYNISIVSVSTLQSGHASWSGGGQAMTFDAGGRWREVVIRLQRDMRCEKCGDAFAHAFTIVTESTSGAQTEAALPGFTPLLENELRHRVRCPRCGAPQNAARRQFVHREQRHSWIGIMAISGNALGTLGLCFGGYALAGVLGLVLGLALSLVLMLALVRWMLARILDTI